MCVLVGRNEQDGGWRNSGNEGKVINETEQKRENNRKVIYTYF